MALIDLVRSKIKDDSGRLTDEDDLIPAITAALEQYGADRPRVIVVDIEGTGTRDIALPESWIPEVSQAVGIEWPVELSTVLGDMDSAFWTIYQAPSGDCLRFLTDRYPDNGETVRFRHTVPRTEATILAPDLEAVANLAASICSETLASLFAQTSDPTISADVVSYRSKSKEHAARAARLRQLYLDHFGSTDGTKAGWAISAQIVPKRGLTH